MTTTATGIQENLTTLQDHLLAKKDVSEGLVGVISTIALATKSIANKVRRARIEDIIGEAGGGGEVNVQGEVQQKLDVISDDLLVHLLSRRADVAVCASEEREEPYVLRGRSAGGEYCVLFDPLDGSSNIDVAAGVGTIFSILRNGEADDTTARAVLQPGDRQLAAGYVLYGSSVLMVLTLGDGVDMFVLDPALGEFVLVKERLEIPVSKKIYSINEAYRNDFSKGIADYLDFVHSNGYASRYIGSMVADVHRTLLKGGVFIYPATAKNPAGKLRLMYEGNPMSMLVEQAGGMAVTGAGRILAVVPQELHERVPVILGSSAEVEAVTRHL